MGLPQFIAWAATQGFKHTKYLRQAYNYFVNKGKIPGKEVILKTAKNFYDKVIAKVPTKKLLKKFGKILKKINLKDLNGNLKKILTQDYEGYQQNTKLNCQRKPLKLLNFLNLLKNHLI